MISEVYQAFREAGVTEEKARAAAEAVHAEQLATKADIVAVRADIARPEKELLVIKWMLGLVIVAVIIPVIRALFT